MDFRIQCMSCMQATKYDALDVITDELCDKCGAKL
jgi:Zn finger protein HypA/HybF involved in hydrogenase expression